MAGADRDRAVYHARAAVRATSQLLSLTATALPEAVCVLVFADANAEAWADSGRRIREPSSAQEITVLVRRNIVHVSCRSINARFT